MITKEELAKIKSLKGMTLYHTEKEYLQYIFLYTISRDETFTFKGGTCLKIAYELERASEYLDFSTELDLEETKKRVKKYLTNYEMLGMTFEFIEKQHEENFRVEVKIQGPLYTGDKRTTNTIKIDCNKRKVVEKETRIIKKSYSDVPAFTIKVMSRKEIIAEKIRALTMRKQPRDMYDVYMQLMLGEKIDKKLLKKKLEEDKIKQLKIDFPTKKEYEEDLKNLTPVLPDYEEVKNKITQELKKITFS